MCATRADRSVAIELAAIGAAALVFVATFQFRPRYLDLVLAAAAVALIVLSTARSRRLWALARSADPTGVRGAEPPYYSGAGRAGHMGKGGSVLAREGLPWSKTRR